MTALEYITKAMKICGALGQNETPTSSEADDGLDAINDMIDSWNTDRTYIYAVTESTIPVVSGQASYTIGTGGDFNITRPVKIDYAFIRINSVDFPLQSINNQDYDSIQYKANQGFPMYYYYNPAMPLGVITIYGVPTQGDLYIDTWTQITEFTNLQTDLTFPPGYRRAFNYNLAKEIAPQFGLSLSPEANMIAVESLANIRNRNLPAPVMKNEIAMLTDSGYYYGDNY
jgi:hypothetical protein